jgi:ferredoxin
MHTLRLPRLNVEVPVKPGETVLSAICRAGMTYTYGCRRGGCGVCRATVRAGSTSYEGKVIAESVLSREDRAAGVVLTCRACPTSDVTVEFAPESKVRMTVPLAFSTVSKTIPSSAGDHAQRTNTGQYLRR